MTILQELFYGNIFSHNDTFDRDSEYGKAIQLIDCNETKLLALLDDTQKSLFTDFREAQVTLNNITAEESFIQGFKMGALIMLEVFEKERGI